METINVADIPPISEEHLKTYGMTREKFESLDDRVRFVLARFCLLPRDRQAVLLKFMRIYQDE